MMVIDIFQTSTLESPAAKEVSACKLNMRPALWMGTARMPDTHSLLYVQQMKYTLRMVAVHLVSVCLTRLTEHHQLPAGAEGKKPSLGWK
jgi:hypothetical protein